MGNKQNMERFTNDRKAYWDQIKAELLGSEDSTQLRFRFLEMGQLFTHAFSFVQLNSSPDQLIQKTWNAKFDNDRFRKGIYNIDRLAVSERAIQLSSKETELLEKLLNEKPGLTHWNGIVLDGLYCHLETEHSTLNWNCNDEINETGLELIEFLRTKTD